MRALRLTIAIAALAAGGCASEPTQPDAPGPAPDQGPPSLVWEVESAAGEIDYIAVQPPVTMPVADVDDTFVTVFENADRSNLVGGGLDRLPVDRLLRLFGLPAGQKLREVIDVETQAAVDAWIAALGAQRPDLLENLHPVAVALLVWTTRPPVKVEAADVPQCDSEGYRSRLRRVPASPTADAATWDTLEQAIKDIPPAQGAALLRTALTASEAEAAVAEEHKAWDAYRGGDLAAIAQAMGAVSAHHPLYGLEALVEGAMAQRPCSSILDNHAVDAMVIYHRQMEGCRADLASAGATLRRLHRGDTLRTATDRAPHRTTLTAAAPTEQTLGVHVTGGPAPQVVRMPADLSLTMVRAAAGRLYFDDTTMILLQDLGATSGRGPKPHTMWNVETNQVAATFHARTLLEIYDGPAGRGVLIHDDAGGGLAMVDPAGQRHVPEAHTVEGAPLAIVRILPFHQGPVVVFATDPSETAYRRGGTGDVYLANWEDLSNSRIVFAPHNRVRVSSRAMRSAISQAGTKLRFGAAVPGVRSPPGPDATCVALDWIEGRATCVRWEGGGRQWVGGLESDPLEVAGATTVQVLGRGLDGAGAVAPTPGCVDPRAWLHQHWVALPCPGHVVFAHGADERVLPVAPGEGRAGARVTPVADGLVVVEQRQSGAHHSVVVNLDRAVVALPAHARVGVGLHHRALLVFGGDDHRTGVYAVDTGVLTWLDGFACAGARSPHLKFASAERLVLQCPEDRKHDAPATVVVVDRATGASVSHEGAFFALGRDKLFLARALPSLPPRGKALPTTRTTRMQYLWVPWPGGSAPE